MESITRQMLIGLLGGMLAYTLITGVAAYVTTYEEAGELFDLQLEQLAAALPDRFSADVDLCQLARQVVADCSTLAESRKIDLGCSTGAQPVVVWESAEHLRTMAGDLVDNAIRYTPDGGKVNVEVVRANDHVSLRVTDNGPGIPEEDRLRVFGRHYQCAGSMDTGTDWGWPSENHCATARRDGVSRLQS